MFRKVLIANRGVVATRIARTLESMGIEWVAVHSKVDEDLPYVRGANEAYCLGAATPRESYLNYDAILSAIKRSQCDAVHPGYGFLSEDPNFARLVTDSGVRLIGPRPLDVETMGNKIRARDRMEGAGIPVLRASKRVPEDVENLKEYAEHVGFPMLVKAAAGGGGIGMQRVSDESKLSIAVEKTRQLSARAFGDGTVYLEQYLEEPRHIEFQMVGDGRGGVRPIYERDCSIQRRHQKVIEETPAPKIDRKACDAMGERLADVLSDWNYESLGTVEMLMGRDGSFYFLEMNTRLQVEHGITEAVTGLDLVEMQIAVAAGKDLADTCPPKIIRKGHAIELRIYAEDPVRFFPSAGKLIKFQPPKMTNVRVETPFAEGCLITPYYDPTLALVIVHGSDRLGAIKLAREALNAFSIEGVKTNIPFLHLVLSSDEFHGCRYHTTIGEQLSKKVA